jgi:hypothetical protein
MVTRGSSVTETDDTGNSKGNWIKAKEYSAEYLIPL